MVKTVLLVHRDYRVFMVSMVLTVYRDRKVLPVWLETRVLAVQKVDRVPRD